jgi:signal recognition particle subunit SRP19
MRGKRKIYIWPNYFDIRLSRKEGRRVPKKISTRTPEASKIFMAAKQLGLNPITKQASYPKQPWIKSGLIQVDKKGQKTKIIRDIAQIISRK